MCLGFLGAVVAITDIMDILSSNQRGPLLTESIWRNRLHRGNQRLVSPEAERDMKLMVTILSVEHYLLMIFGVLQTNPALLMPWLMMEAVIIALEAVFFGMRLFVEGLAITRAEVIMSGTVEDETLLLECRESANDAFQRSTDKQSISILQFCLLILLVSEIMDGVTVCVLGAGVVGLTTALSLQEKVSNVVIIAEKFTTETTSDGAAGLFCPFSSFQAATYKMTRDIVKDSYEYYQNLRNVFGEDKTGIFMTSGYILSNVSVEEVKNPLIENLVLDYRILTADELKDCPGEWKYGSFFKTLLINGRIFLPWALRMFQKNGGKIIQRKLLCLEDLTSYKFDAVINCTGIGAKQLFEDKHLVPMRGQVIKVSAPWLKEFYLLDNDIYIIPGIETTLGGSREYGNYDLTVNKHLSAHIWENCTRFLPSLKEAAVIREWAGLRPYRVPIRLEAEIKNVKGVQLKIVHNYGHGAQGVTTAPGTAKIAVELVVDMLKKSKL